MDDGKHTSGEIASNRPMYSIMSNWLLFQKEKNYLYLKNSPVYPVKKKKKKIKVTETCMHSIYICKLDQGFELLTILFKQISAIQKKKKKKKSIIKLFCPADQKTSWLYLLNHVFLYYVHDPAHVS